MKKSLLATALLACGMAFGADFSVGIRIGPPPPPRVVHHRPPEPGPGYFWVDGYWYPEGGRYHWHEGYWTRPPYEGATWVAPRYEGGEFFEGRWHGDRGDFRHDHQWDHSRERDYHRDDRDHH
jgi:hypothetical protein